MEEKTKLEYGKFLKGFLITLVIFMLFPWVYSIAMYATSSIPSDEIGQVIAGMTGSVFIICLIPSLFGGAFYVKKGIKGVFWTVGITLAIIVLAIATCAGILSNI